MRAATSTSRRRAPGWISVARIAARSAPRTSWRRTLGRILGRSRVAAVAALTPPPAASNVPGPVWPRTRDPSSAERRHAVPLSTIYVVAPSLFAVAAGHQLAAEEGRRILA